MKTTIVETPTKPEPVTYPCVMKHNKTGTIVLFISPERGTPIWIDTVVNSGARLGDYGTGWDMTHFKLLNDITINFKS